MGNTNAKLRKLDLLNSTNILDTESFITAYNAIKDKSKKQSTFQTEHVREIEDKLENQKYAFSNLSEKLSQASANIQTETHKVEEFKEKLIRYISEEKDLEKEKLLIESMVNKAVEKHQLELQQIQELQSDELDHYEQLVEANLHNQREIQVLEDIVWKLEKSRDDKLSEVSKPEKILDKMRSAATNVA